MVIVNNFICYYVFIYMIEDVDVEKEGRNCYKNNSLLMAKGVQLPLTQEHIDEIKKVANDIEYFIRTYVKIITLDSGPQLFGLHDYQKDWINKCQNNKFVIGKWSRQSGKCVTEDTMITVRNKNTNEVETIPIGIFYRQMQLANS